MDLSIAALGGTGSRLTRVFIIISGVASLVATLLSVVYVLVNLVSYQPTDSKSRH
jgi:uncharacterized membrane protein YuzA (DUF378 family)